MAVLALYAAIIIYALFSSPTPDVVGSAEYAIAALMCAAIGIVRGWNNITRPDYPAFIAFHRLFILYMLSVPLAVGVIAAYPKQDIIRDILPVIFLILPLCFGFRPLPRFEVLLTAAGTIFALRFLAQDFMHDGSSLLYLANSPLLPFAALTGFYYAIRAENGLLLFRVTSMLCCLICLAAMAAMLQRAPFILSVLGCLGILMINFPSRPLTSFLTLATLCTLCIFVMPDIDRVISLMSHKTLSVGWNSRIEEWHAVMADLTIFGKGWGAIWQSPAVADIWVRYTHNMLSYYMLKAGIIGGLLALAFIYVWGLQLLRYFKTLPSEAIAGLIPLLIHFTLYTGFKTLDFALILTLVTLRSWQPRNQNQSS